MRSSLRSSGTTFPMLGKRVALPRKISLISWRLRLSIGLSLATTSTTSALAYTTLHINCRPRQARCIESFFRSEERREGKGGVSSCSTEGWAYHNKKKKLYYKKSIIIK